MDQGRQTFTAIVHKLFIQYLLSANFVELILKKKIRFCMWNILGVGLNIHIHTQTNFQFKSNLIS